MKKGSAKSVILIIIALLLLAMAGAYYYSALLEWSTPAYAASENRTVSIYRMNDDDPEQAAEIVRGTAVRKYGETVEADGEVYCRIACDALPAEGDSSDTLYYIREDQLAESPDDVVRETEVYVRTPVTIYAKEEGPEIKSFAAKGTCLKVTGFDRMLEDGSIFKYKVEFDKGKGKKGEGYVYGKYLVMSQEEADAVYNEHGEHDKAAADKFHYNLYGGKAANLDYYPYERTEIEGNEFCTNARAMYINAVALLNPDPYIALIKKSGCNAVVIDIKDGALVYMSEVAREWSPTSYRSAYMDVEKMRENVNKYKDAGVYLIGRIVVFNDSNYAKDHPEDCIKYNNSRSWPSAYSRDVWEYNVRLAQEAVNEFGFNEIQFDYVRFPEASFDMSASGNADFRNKYKEEKGQAIQNFCFYATDQIHEAGAYLSVDVFGESVYGYMTAYGQYWPGLANIVDAISAMPYTDHTGGEGAWKKPYDTMYSWGKRAKKMQDYLQDPAVPRTWITGYNTPYWAPTENYDEDKLNAQIKALKKAGLDGGFIPWNAASDLDKYKQYQGIWKE